MAKYRQAAKVDDNQAQIVLELRAIPGVSVQTGHDDLLVGHAGQTYWVEVKRPDQRRKDGEWKAGALKPAQKALLESWTGHYLVACTSEEILRDIGLMAG